MSLSAHDGYARLDPVGIQLVRPVLESGLLFVDVTVGSRDRWRDVAHAWRFLPPGLVEASSRIVVRSPVVDGRGQWSDLGSPVVPPDPNWPTGIEAFQEALTDAHEAARLPMRDIFAFALPLGGDAEVAGADADDAPALLARCRAVELLGLLEATGGIWRPSSYHYRLPSGQHAGSFVRIADVFRASRAAAALASWLRGGLTLETTMAFDSGTLMPLAEQLDGLVTRFGAALNGTVAFDRFPRSRFEYLRQFKPSEGADVLAVLSVSSSGRTYRLLEQSLNQTLGDAWRAECLVARQEPAATALPPASERARQAPWATIEDPLPSGSGSDSCRLCADSERSTVIRIDPRTFGAMALPAPTRVMPDTGAAARNASLLEQYEIDVLGTPAVQLAASEASRLRVRPLLREEQPDKVRFEPVGLLMRDEVETRVERRIAEFERFLPRSPSAHGKVTGALTRLRALEPTLVVVDPEERSGLGAALADGRPRQPADEREALERFRRLAQVVCPTVTEVVAGTAGCELESALEKHSRVLIVCAGLQTGVTMQRLVVTIGDAKRGSHIGGLVVHAHPHDRQSWASVCNTFGGRAKPRLLALWLTFLPLESPFLRERELLAEGTQKRWFEAACFGARQRLEDRLTWLTGSGTGRPLKSPLWATQTHRLRPTSLFGDVDDRRLVAGMGAALTDQLDAATSANAPEWVQVNLLNALRSYFDGILHATLLRWTHPGRAWWGTDDECRSLIDELKARFEATDDWPMLLAELLLATAMGKLPAAGGQHLIDHARRELDSASPGPGPDEDHPLGYVELALMLAERRGEEKAEGGQTPSVSARS